jgi:uncharacterized protein (TIGR00266 family)
MTTEQSSFRIAGSDLQFVELTLRPGGEAVGEPGAMMYMDEGIKIDTVLGDGSSGKWGFLGRLGDGFRRLFAGESMFSVIYANTDGAQTRRIAFAAPGVGKIVGFNLGEHGGELICQRGAFLGGARGVKLGIAFQKKLRVGLFGGQGFVMQRLQGNGPVFVHASGALTEVALEPGRLLRVDTGCIVAMETSVTYDIKFAGRMKTALFGGEGLFVATLRGPGKIWLQSLPLRKLALNIMRAGFYGQNRGYAWLYVIFVIVFILVTLFLGPVPE